MSADSEYEVTVIAFGLDEAAQEALFDRVVEAAHALDEELFCVGGPDQRLAAVAALADSLRMSPRLDRQAIGASLRRALRYSPHDCDCVPDSDRATQTPGGDQ